jgi:hypothetical protein
LVQIQTVKDLEGLPIADEFLKIQSQEAIFFTRLAATITLNVVRLIPGIPASTGALRAPVLFLMAEIGLLPAGVGMRIADKKTGPDRIDRRGRCARRVPFRLNIVQTKHFRSRRAIAYILV